MWFLTVPDRVAWITGTAVDAVLHAAADAEPLETGGLLMGYHTADCLEVVITDIVGPGPDAVHASDAFTPDYPYHERMVAELYESSGGTTTYLGDWHTHPGGTPSPSKTDTAALRQIARSPEARAPEPIMGIAAGPDPWRLAVWQLPLAHRWRRRRPRVLPVQTFEA
jgi:integrative and conjugative element protein (TIGR02256 family)